MGQGRSYGETTGLWQRLLAALIENAERLPDMRLELSVLEQALADAQDAKSRQDLFRANGQRATQDLSAALARGQDAATQLRGAARFKLNPHDEKLVQFQVAPQRKRGPRKNVKATTPAPKANLENV